MTNTMEQPQRYPLLTALLEQRGLSLQGLYTIRDAAKIFGVSTRTIQEWCRDGKLTTRDLPGRNRFLSEDLEQFLRESVRTRERSPNAFDGGTGGRERSLGRQRKMPRLRETARSFAAKEQSSLFRQIDDPSS